MSFFIDTAANKSLLTKQSLKKNVDSRFTSVLDNSGPKKVISEVVLDNEEDDEEDSDYDGSFFGLPPPSVDLSNIINNALTNPSHRLNKLDQELKIVAERVDSAVERSRPRSKSYRRIIKDLDTSDFDQTTGKLAAEHEFATDVKEVMAKSALQPGFEQLKALPNHNLKNLRKIARTERAKTKGAAWFDMPATEATEEVRNDLKILQMRSVLDPKHFYKKNDLKVLPKYFQIGTVQHSPLDYYSERHTRKNKKHTLLEEVMKDDAIIKYSKRKYQEVVARRDKYAHRKAMKKMKKLKKNK